MPAAEDVVQDVFVDALGGWLVDHGCSMDDRTSAQALEARLDKERQHTGGTADHRAEQHDRV
jgi:hypothetical protein